MAAMASKPGQLRSYPAAWEVTLVGLSGRVVGEEREFIAQ